MDGLRDLPPETRFIVAVRSSILDLRRHVFESKFPLPLGSLGLDRIDTEDKRALRNILDQSGVRVADLDHVINKSTSFRDIVATLYDNTQIRAKITAELEPLLSDPHAKSVLVVTHLFRFIGEEPISSVLRQVTGSDPYSTMIKFPEIARDILGMDDDDLESKSALFSEYIIQSHVGTQSVMDCVFLLVVAAVRRKAEPRYQAILGKLMRYSELSRVLNNDPKRSDALKALFERLALDRRVNLEPLFWLQYAILMRNREELTVAEKFIVTAYARARENPGFRTYQLDTYALKLLMLMERELETSGHVTRLAQILDKFERVRHMIGDENHVLHAVSAVRGTESFVARRLGAMATAEKRALGDCLGAVCEELDGLSGYDRDRTEADEVRASIERAMGLLGAEVAKS